MRNSTTRENGAASTGTPMIVLTPQRSGIRQEGGTLDVLVRVQAPAAPTMRRERPPLHLALVLDRSGSMQGQPIREAVRCAEFIVAGLAPRDQAALIVYDNHVDTLVPLSPAADKARFLRALRGVESRGGTALHAGWLEGAKLLAPHTGGAALSRVLLLSDGEANQGLTDATAIGLQCRALSQAGVTTTTIGLGRNFNEVLMMEMARQGGGEGYYGQTAGDLQDKFQEELSLVQALFAGHLTTQLIPGPGVIVEVRSIVGLAAGQPAPLSDLAFEAEVFLLIRLHYTPKNAGNHLLLSVVVKGETMDSGVFELRPALLELPAVSETVAAALPKDALVERRLTEVEAANLFDAVRDALLSSDRKAAEQLLTEAKRIAATHEWVRESVVALEQLLSHDALLAAKELYHKAGKLRNRQTLQQEVDWMETGDAEAPAYLRRKTEEGKREKEMEAGGNYSPCPRLRAATAVAGPSTNGSQGQRADPSQR